MRSRDVRGKAALTIGFLASMTLGACGVEGDDALLHDVTDEGAFEGEELEEIAVGELESGLTLSLSNLGFEDEWSGWTREGSTGLSTVAHSGSTSGKVRASAGYIGRRVTGLKKDTTYTVSAYVRGHARIGARNFGRTYVSKEVSSGTSWKKVSVSFKTGTSSTSAELYARWAGGGDARVDDFSLSTGGTGTSSPTSSDDCVPAQILDVSPWKLQIPTGSPTVEVKNPTLESYSSTYFQPNGSCSGVRFRAHTSGTTTSGSEYPRSELREVDDDGDKKSWSTTSGMHRMFIDQAVTALPRGKREMGVGQIHNGDNDLMIVRVEGNKLLIKPNGSSAHVLDSNYELGERFTIELKASGGTISVYYNGGSSPAFSFTRKTGTAYFKAGAYVQSNCETEADEGESCGTSNYGEVVIYDLWIRHS